MVKQNQKSIFPFPNPFKARDNSLYLFGIFVANEYDDWVDVNAVKSFDGVRSNVKQAVTVL